MTFSRSRRVFLLSAVASSLAMSLFSRGALAGERSVLNVPLEDGEAEVRIFHADGDRLLLGFACDEGSSVSEEKTAASLASDGIEVWMPDMLGAYMLPKSRSSIYEIPTSSMIKIIKQAVETGKDVYLIAGGPDTELVLRAAQAWEASPESDKHPLKGAVLMFPRLNKSAPQPGKPPEYVDAVGKTKLPLMVLEGERTPNRWGIKHLTRALEQGGSPVMSKLIPDVRGYFFKREDANMPEEVVTSQLSGVIKASLYYLRKLAEKTGSQG